MSVSRVRPTSRYQLRSKQARNIGPVQQRAHDMGMVQWHLRGEVQAMKIGKIHTGQ